MGGFIRTNAGMEQLGFVRGPAMIYAAPATQAPPANIGDVLRLTGSPANEVQTLTITGTPTGGTFKLAYKSVSTATIAYNATSAAVQAALEALSTIGSGNVVCAGGPLPASPVTITFQGLLAGSNLPLVTVNSAAFTAGTTPAATVAETTPGSGLYDPLGGWFPLGGTKNGVNPSMNNTEEEFTIDQQKVSIGVLPNEFTWAFTTSLVEVTPENLAFVWDMGPVTLNTLPAIPGEEGGLRRAGRLHGPLDRHRAPPADDTGVALAGALLPQDDPPSGGIHVRLRLHRRPAVRGSADARAGGRQHLRPLPERRLPSRPNRMM
jgi:hypothetical protein